ncbi:MAG: putative flavoprotein YhiN [Nonlabens sp.]|jgi:predicted flavoprotein YhiN
MRVVVRHTRDRLVACPRTVRGMVNQTDVVVVGAGAAGCFAALAARGAIAPDGSPVPPAPDAPDVLLLDGQDQPGRKILISGGGRCNVTNAVVRPQDYITSSPKRLRSQLRELGPDPVRHFFAAMGVPLTEEPLGKLFPADGGVARDVLGALHHALADAGVATRYGTPVRRVAPTDGRWQLDDVTAQRVVLATGGRSVPATGSTGFGLELAGRLGHTMVAAVPALAPVLGRTDTRLAGQTVPVILTVSDPDGRVRRRAAGSLLFTHRGVSGPAALDVSEEVERGGDDVRVTADLWSLTDPNGPMGSFLDAPKLPGACLPDTPAPTDTGELDRTLARMLADADRGATLGSVLRPRVARRLIEVLVGDDAALPAGQVPKAVRRRVARSLTALDLAASGTGGYAKAEVTAGGVHLDELDRRTLESSIAPGLHLCGEVCDVTGRLGGLNFQWAWTSGYLAGRGAAAALTRPGTPG